MPLKDFLVKLFSQPVPQVKQEIEKKEEVPKEKKKKVIVQKSIFRPRTFDEYIGQDNAKNILKQYIVAVKERNMAFPHLLIHGRAGGGKTSLARIVANELKVKMVETITSAIENDSMLISLVEDAHKGILFMDEIHSLDRNNAEKIYPIMEEGKYKGIKTPVTIIGATTELGEILKDRKPLYERFKIVLELEPYKINELVLIGKQYKNQIFLNDTIQEDIFQTIADNSRGTPRTAIRLLEATVYFKGNIKEVLKNYNIIYQGYTYVDLKVLEYITKSISGAGIQGIVSYLDTSIQNYTYQIEPYLLQTGCIVRTPRGRKITEQGVKTISKLKEIANR